MKKYTYILLFSLFIILSGCGEDDDYENNELASSVQGWHFQGRDCLACHNLDLSEDKHLLFAGTVYKNSNILNQDDINNTCGGELLIEILDNTFTPVYKSKDYKDDSSSGYKGKGNVFILQRQLRLLAAGTYAIRITDINGTTMAQSKLTHKFTSQDYDINNPVDWDNRLSCNSCHIKGGNQDPLYIEINANLCK